MCQWYLNKCRGDSWSRPFRPRPWLTQSVLIATLQLYIVVALHNGLLGSHRLLLNSISYGSTYACRAKLEHAVQNLSLVTQTPFKKHNTRISSLLLDHIVSSTVGVRSHSNENEVEANSFYRGCYWPVFLVEWTSDLLKMTTLLMLQLRVIPQLSFLSDELFTDTAIHYSIVLNWNRQLESSKASCSTMLLASMKCKYNYDRCMIMIYLKRHSRFPICFHL